MLIGLFVIYRSYVLGKLGHTQRLDVNGEAEGNFMFLARRYNHTKKEWGMYPIGSFTLNENQTGLPVS